jgi:hypothetical protein
LWSFLVLAIVIYQVAALVEWRRQWFHFTSQALLLVALVAIMLVGLFADERIHKLIQFSRNMPPGAKSFSSNLDIKAEDSQTLTIVCSEASGHPVHVNFIAIPPQRHVNS